MKRWIYSTVKDYFPFQIPHHVQIRLITEKCTQYLAQDHPNHLDTLLNLSYTKASSQDNSSGQTYKIRYLF
jgi:hypothetical protein